MRLWRQLCLLRQTDLWPARVVRHRERLNEALRRARNQRELHIVPVCPSRVVHHRPALQRRRLRSGNRASLRLREQNPVGRLPDRYLADVADAQLARAGPVVLNRQMPQPLIARAGQQLQIARHVLVQVGVQQRHRGRRCQLHGAHLAALADHRNQPLLLNGFPVLFSRVDEFNVQQPSADCRARPTHLHARAAYRVVKIHRRRILAQRQRQRLQLFLQRRGRVVPRARDPPAVQVDRRQRLQHVVQLRGGEVNRHGLVARHAPRVLEKSHAVLVQCDARHRKLGRSRSLRARRLCYRLRGGLCSGLLRDGLLRACRKGECKKKE